MPRYFLNIRDGADVIEDLEGSILPDIEAACREAVAAARDILAEKLRAGEVMDGQVFEITDEAGIVRARLPLKEALRLA
ncbi:hypothetical protein [Methylobacterium sp.]|jgi:hypothetical protein|uniref:DUF6894 family protein n=1 Tax=Methylobacterium sp. TaxID=409 RepID=UPI00262697DA|nr:hypothetical protein [Methylobacterium sp.]MDB5645823.1 hypothetical protein [Methylobacterium sp.]